MKSVSTWAGFWELVRISSSLGRRLLVVSYKLIWQGGGS